MILESNEHEIQESSALFQGHIDQCFSKRKISFQVQALNENREKIQEFNPEKFRKYLAKTINSYIDQRRQEGYDYAPVNEKDLRIAYPMFVDNAKEEGPSGRYRMYPRTAICTRCRTYLELDKGDDCGCNAPLEQFTFVAFCDECGAAYPIHAMSNVKKDCQDCGEIGGMKKITWKSRDILTTYRVRCVKCSSIKSLVLFECDHKDHQTGMRRSNRPRSRFRGVPARSGAIVHPLVISMPDIPQMDEIQDQGSLNSSGRQLTEAFDAFFGEIPDVDESHLFLPEFWDCIASKSAFWENQRIKAIVQDFGLDNKPKSHWTGLDRWRVLRTALVDARGRVTVGTDGATTKSEIINKYSLGEINDCLRLSAGTHFDEAELQGVFLISGETGLSSTKKRELPRNPPANWRSLLKEYGLEKIIQISDMHMIQALLGIVEGSTRRDVLLFRVIEAGPKGNKKPTVYVRRFETEGVVFKLDSERVLEWLRLNGSSLGKTEVSRNAPSIALRLSVQEDDAIHDKVYELLHTLSHVLIQQSSIDTGLDASSLSEAIYPSLASFLIYSTSNINIGGLEDTYDNHMGEWLMRIRELASDCPQDPGCMEDEGGSCNACLFLPEFVCENFNKNLDRSCLVGGPRHVAGFFR
jgi:hypothetical protein